jgi:hypothetical protein
MAIGVRLIPQRIDIDKYPALNTPDTARYIKNLVYDITDTSTATNDQGGASGVYKPLQSVVEYIEDFTLPDSLADNFPIGKYQSKDTREVFVFVHNKNSNHQIYRLNGNDATYNIVYQGAELDFQLNPEHFIHEGGAYLEAIYLTDPETGEKVRRSFLMFTDGYGDQRQICIEDAIATNGYDPILFPYFAGDYDRKLLINMGVPTPHDCIEISELDNNEPAENNSLLFQTWQWRIRYIDVWGRPSEWGIVSDMYILGGSDCITTGSGLPRCLNLIFNYPPPHINQIEIAYRNCNSIQWYKADTLNLYKGSSIGEWWMRERNTELSFQVDKIIYKFCADKKCDPIAPAESNRVINPQPRTSQSVAKIGDFIGLSNNKDGFLPFSDDLKSKIKISVDTTSSIQTNNFVNIEVYVALYNPAININQPIFQQGITDPSNLRYGFGAFNTDQQYRAFFAYQQYFPAEDQKGFIGYLAGTNISTISKQYFLSNTGVLSEVEDFTQNSLRALYYKNSGSKPNGTFLQKFSFNNVPKGKYIFRIASHRFDAAPGLDFRKTSTYTSGLYALIGTNYTSPVNYTINSRLNEAKEIVVDACETSYDGLKDSKILVIFDLCFSGSDIEQGYMINTNEEGQAQYGIELLQKEGGDLDKKSNYTDHNGFFFSAFSARSSANRINRIYGYCGCVKKIIYKPFTTGNNDNAHTIIYRYLNDDLSECPSWNIEPCNQIKIKGKVKLCGTDIGVPNVSVILTRGKAAVTDANGEYTILASDDVINPNRNEKIYFATNGCAFEGCESTCIEPIDITIFKCVSCEERVVTVSDVFVSFKTSKGLLSGATYPVGVVGWDWLGRATYVQPLGDLTIPSVQQTKVFTPSQIVGQIDADAIFPEDIEYITFWIGSPNGILEYITWIVDKVEFVDNSGAINEEAPTQIKIYYASLIEYNKQNNYNTTVNWSFINSETNEPVLSDKVIFLLNGDGSFFDKSITALVKYDQDGQYFLINYTNDLKDLKENAIIRIVRPKACETTDFYYELCSTIDIISRKASITNFILNAFDTYYVNRQIPVPIEVGDDDIQIQLRVFGVPFEHNSPSDFWGEKCRNIGRINAENPQETEVYHDDQVALSGALSENGQLNFLNYFDSAKKTNFSDTYINGIVSVLPYPGILLIIGQSDNFIVGFNDNLVRVNADGTAQAGSIANAFGKPQTKILGNYGCRLFDKNTISRHENIVQWLDSTLSTVVQHNYVQAVQVTKADPKLGIPGGVDSWIRPKIKAVQQYNVVNGNTRYFHGTINPVNMEYILTDFIIGSNNYINTERGMNVFVPETVSFNTVTKFWRNWYGFVPPMYAYLQGEISAQQLFSFINGVPYKHYSTNNQGHGTVYGKKVNRVFEPVAVIDGMNKKRFNSISQYCKQGQYFCDRATDENDQETRILLDNWNQAEYGWFAPFMCDLNTPFSENDPKQTGELKIAEGNVMYGNFIIVRMVGNPLEDDKYSELQGIIVYASKNSIS